MRSALVHQTPENCVCSRLDWGDCCILLAQFTYAHGASRMIYLSLLRCAVFKWNLSLGALANYYNFSFGDYELRTANHCRQCSVCSWSVIWPVQCIANEIIIMNRLVENAGHRDMCEWDCGRLDSWNIRRANLQKVYEYTNHLQPQRNELFPHSRHSRAHATPMQHTIFQKIF